MNRIILLLSTLILPILLYSQDTEFPRLKNIADSIREYKRNRQMQLEKDIEANRYFSSAAYDRFFDKYFTLMQYQRDNFTEGNSAALKVDEKASTLNLTLSRKVRNKIISIGTVVNVSDGSGVIFSGDKPTAGTELFGSVSYLLTGQRKIVFRGDHMETNWRKRQWILDSLELLHVFKIPNSARKLRVDSLKLELQKEHFMTLLKSTDTTTVAQYQDSVVNVSDKLYKVKEELRNIDNGSEPVEDIVESIKGMADRFSVQNELETPGVNSFTLTWLTGSVRYRKDNLKTYDSLLLFSKRIGEMPFDRWTFQGSFNLLWQKSDAFLKWNERNFLNSFFAGVSFSLVRTNSFQKLQETNLSLSKVRSQNDSVYEFSEPYKLIDVSNKSFTEGWILRPSLTLTPMFGSGQFVGLNLITSGEFEKGMSPVFNFRSGLLFRFKDSEKEKPLVNFELFLSFLDLTDTQASGKSVWQNKRIGVSANVPFEKVFFR